MSVTTTTHLNFRGDARAALEFYQSVFGGRLAVVTYTDTGNVRRERGGLGHVGPGGGENGFHVMAYDVPSQWPGTRAELLLRLRARRDPRRSAASGGGSPTGRPWWCRWSRRSGPRCTGCSPTVSASPGSWMSRRRTAADRRASWDNYAGPGRRAPSGGPDTAGRKDGSEPEGHGS